MLLDEIAQFLEDNHLGVVDETIGTGRTSDALVPQLTVYETPGSAPLQTQNSDGAAQDQPRFQVAAQAPKYADARNLAERAYRVLITVRNESLSGVFYLRITAGTPPFPIGRDPNDQAKIVCNYLAVKAPSPVPA
jgi:hypothetical protein